MKKRVNWTLKSDSHVLVFEKDALCDYDPGKELIKYENETKNRIDIANKIYERTGPDFVMVIDFKKQLCTFIFSETEKCSFDIKAIFQENKNSLVLKYALDDEIKEINISWKE